MKTYTTLAGARRATHRHPVPIVRILVDGTQELFIPVTTTTTIYAVDRQTGRADGKIDIDELMTRG